jgi:hypothetical protein
MELNCVIPQEQVIMIASREERQRREERERELRKVVHAIKLFFFRHMLS